MANINKRMKKNIENRKVLNADKLTALEAQERLEKRQSRIRYTIMMIVYAAIYFGITALTQPIAYNVHQFRIADCLIGLVFFDPAAFPGVCIGCFAANIIGPGGISDAILGTCASAFGIYAMKWWAERNGKPYIGMALYAFLNAVMISLMLSYDEASAAQYSILAMLFWILLGDIICAVGGGYIIHFIASKRWEDIVSETKKGKDEKFHTGTLQ